MKLSEYPSVLHPYLEGAEVSDCSSRSIATTLFITKGYYLKIAPKGCLEAEARFTRWFHQKGLGVEVVKYFTEDKDFFLTKQAEGKVLTACLDEPALVCQALATGLQRLHSLPISDFPQSDKMDDYLRSAEEHYRLGCFDKSLLVPGMQFADSDEAWAVIQRNKDRLQSDCIVHGDFCLPNVLMKDGKFIGLIDWGQAGVGDRHIDLYWAIWSLWYNLKTAEYTDYLIDAYGQELVDEELLRTIAAIEAFG